MTENRPTVLVTGASGFMGRHVAQLALDAGCGVRTLTRRDDLTGARVPASGRFLGSLPLDLPDTAFQDVDTVIHLAWLTAGEGEHVARTVNVEGSRHLLRLSHRAGVRKIVFVSSQSAREDGFSPYARTKAAAEKVFLDGPLPVTILRPGLVYGPGERGLFARMRSVVVRSPLLPVLGDGLALVQPIHVADLTAAILGCLEPGNLDGRILRLGAPEPLTLVAFLRLLCRVECGRVKPVLRIPIRPLIPLLEGLEARGVSLPVTSDNLKGALRVERMECAGDLAALGLALRPLEEGLEGVKAAVRAPVAGRDGRALGLAVLGAGKMGMIHAVTADRQPGLRLAALVDPKPKARAMLAGMGVKAPGFASLEEACRSAVVDVAVIATPPSTHLALARECRAQDLGVLVEKPMVRSPDELERFRGALDGKPLVVGYLAPSYPQFQAARSRLRNGAFGTPRGFEAFCMLGVPEKSSGWEMRPEISGGGVLINVASHVVSMICEAFGDPERVSGETVRLFSDAVEDSLVARFEYPELRGTLYASWAIPAYPNPENRLVVSTDQGRLVCTNSLAFFCRHDGEVTWIDHQLNHREGFNLAPDFSGGGVTAELQQLCRLTRDGKAPRVGLEEGAALEKVLHTIYAQSVERQSFSTPSGGQDGIESRIPRAERSAGNGADDSREEPATRIVWDIRRVDPRASARWPAVTQGNDAWMMLAPQSHRWRALGMPSRAQTVVLPDFLHYGRLLGAGQALPLLRILGGRATGSLGWQALRSVLHRRGVTFWVAVESLLAADLAHVPRAFDGTLLLHPFVTDLAVALDLASQLDRLLHLIATRRRRAQVGVATSILPDTLAALVYARQPPAAVHFLSSPASPVLARTLAEYRKLEPFACCRFVAEVGAVPGLLAAAAGSRPQEWCNGAEAVVVEPVTAPWTELQRQRLEVLWRRAFPGLPFNESAF